MRITFALSQERTIRNINKKAEAVERLTTSVSLGKRLLKASDDPMAWSRAMDLKQSVRDLGAIEKNLDFAVTWNEMTEDSLSQLSELTIRGKEVAAAALSSDSAEKRDGLTATLDQLIQEALDAANTQFGDRYLFSGSSNPDSGPPFTMDENGVVEYHGDTESIRVRTGKGANRTSTVNINGDELLNFTDKDSTVNVLQNLWELKEAIQNGDSTAIGSKEDALDTALQHFSKHRSVVGSRLNTLEDQLDSVATLKIEYYDRLNDVEGADLAEMITDLQQKRTSYEVSLRVTSLLDGLNLAQFL